jgi:hypothetical protein
MIRTSHTSVIFCLVTLLIGCNNHKSQQKPIWEEVKIGDLAPATGSQQNHIQKIEGIYFQVHIFEVPAETSDKIDEISKILYAHPFHFNHFNAFNANLFSVGFGRISFGEQIFQILSDAKAAKTGSTSLLLTNGQTNDIPILKLFESRNIYYISADGTTKSATIGPGVLSLRIKADKIPEFRGVCNVTVLPVFPFPFTANIPNARTEENMRDILFDCCGFSLKMSPGDYFFLRAQKYIGHQNSLGSLFFSRPGLRPALMAYLIVCTDIVD